MLRLRPHYKLRQNSKLLQITSLAIGLVTQFIISDDWVTSVVNIKLYEEDNVIQFLPIR